MRRIDGATEDQLHQGVNVRVGLLERWKEKCVEDRRHGRRGEVFRLSRESDVLTGSWMVSRVDR